MTQKLLTLMIMIVPLIFSSCTSHTAIETDDPNIQSVLLPRDKVRIVTKDNRETQFEVVKVTDEQIVGESENIKFSNIDQLEKIQISSGAKVLLYTVGITGFIALVLISGSGDGGISSRPWW